MLFPVSCHHSKILCIFIVFAMNKYLVAIYRNDDNSLQFHLSQSNFYSRNEITEALKVLIGDVDFEHDKRTKYAQALLLGEADPDGKSGDGVPFLYSLCEQNEMELVNLLINFGCDVNACTEDGSCALHVAASGGKTDLIGLLLASGSEANAADYCGNTPLMKALESGIKDQEIYSLLMMDADLNARNAFEGTALHVAAYNNMLGATEMMLDNGADVNALDKNKCTPLHYACCNQKCFNANSSQRDEIRFHQHEICEELMTVLITGGANINAQTQDEITPLHIISGSKNGVTALRILLSCPSLDIDPVTRFNETPLVNAIRAESIDNVRLLLQSGANCNFIIKSEDNGSQKNVLEIALALNNARIVQMLILSGAKVSDQLSTDLLLALNLDEHVENGSKMLLTNFCKQNLGQLCRLAIREQIVKNRSNQTSHTLLFEDIKNLSLPQRLSDFVALKDLDSL